MSNPLNTSATGKRAILVLALEAAVRLRRRGHRPADGLRPHPRHRRRAVRRHLHGHPPVRHGDLRQRDVGRRQPRHRLHRGRRRSPPGTSPTRSRAASGRSSSTSRTRSSTRRPAAASLVLPCGPAAQPLVQHLRPVHPRLAAYFLGDGVTPATSPAARSAPTSSRCADRSTARPIRHQPPFTALRREELFTVTGMLHDPNAVVGSPLSVTARLLQPHRRRLPGRRDGSRLPEPRPGRSPEAHRRRPVRRAGADGGTRPSSATGTPRASPFRARDVPTQITVTNSGDVPPTSITTHIVDEVTIKAVAYAGGTLTVVATSSDKGDPTACPADPPRHPRPGGLPGRHAGSRRLPTAPR